MYHLTSSSTLRRLTFLTISIFLVAIPALAQSPWESAANRMRDAFVVIARALAVVAVIIGGLTLAFGESHQQKSAIGALIFGLTLALGAAAFITWIVG